LERPPKGAWGVLSGGGFEPRRVPCPCNPLILNGFDQMGYLTGTESGVIHRRLGPVVIQWCDGACGDPSSDAGVAWGIQGHRGLKMVAWE
jgi:hypothetical protein